MHVQNIGWDRFQNGDLIRAAEEEGFDVIMTADKNLRYQQNIEGRKIGIVVLNSRFLKLSSTEPLGPQVQAALDGEFPQGSFVVIGPEETAR